MMALPLHGPADAAVQPPRQHRTRSDVDNRQKAVLDEPGTALRICDDSQIGANHMPEGVGYGRTTVFTQALDRGGGRGARRSRGGAVSMSPNSSRGHAVRITGPPRWRSSALANAVTTAQKSAMTNCSRRGYVAAWGAAQW